MKKLQPKTVSVTRSTIADNLVNELREKLKTHIGILIPKLYEGFGWPAPDFTEYEDWVIPTGDLGNPIYIKVAVHDTYTLDNEEPCYTRVEIAEIVYALDGNVIVRNEDGDEWLSTEISIDELATIASELEKTYWKLAK